MKIADVMKHALLSGTFGEDGPLIRGLNDQLFIRFDAVILNHDGGRITKFTLAWRGKEVLDVPELKGLDFLAGSEVLFNFREGRVPVDFTP